MTAQSPAAERVREALRALAVDPHCGTSDSDRSTRRPTDARRDLVAEGERALASVRAAAAFADDDGFRRTGTVAETTADPALARRARGVVETVERYRAAHEDAASGVAVDPTDSADTESLADTEDPADPANHFHSARDRHIPTAEQPEGN
ncbi:hypothetical protein GRX01_07710 [Halobaculum sp. WSA2]|uniref:Uncharacterized protein n=1 Tax=Halobaculum saliterrae TaxID=2073113 RepID=A0A6B0SY25_9EURY|nr:hypothetical protein [Halobaculum saliterrae]MXR41222.1 hypothetical protein [Halobaculum saliterrae]